MSDWHLNDRDRKLYVRILEAGRVTELSPVEFWGPPCWRCDHPERLHPGYCLAPRCDCGGSRSFEEERRYREEFPGYAPPLRRPRQP